MKYIEKLTPEKFYVELNEMIKSGSWASHLLSDAKSFMDKYKSNPVKIIEIISEFIVNSANEIDDYYKTLTDDEYMDTANYPDDIRKIQKDFSDMGFIISPLEAEAIWEIRSDNWCAQWLDMSGLNTFIECVLFGIIQPY